MWRGISKLTFYLPKPNPNPSKTTQHNTKQISLILSLDSTLLSFLPSTALLTVATGKLFLLSAQSLILSFSDYCFRFNFPNADLTRFIRSTSLLNVWKCNCITIIPTFEPRRVDCWIWILNYS